MHGENIDNSSETGHVGEHEDDDVAAVEINFTSVTSVNPNHDGCGNGYAYPVDSATHPGIEIPGYAEIYGEKEQESAESDKPIGYSGRFTGRERPWIDVVKEKGKVGEFDKTPDRVDDKTSFAGTTLDARADSKGISRTHREEEEGEDEVNPSYTVDRRVKSACRGWTLCVGHPCWKHPCQDGA